MDAETFETMRMRTLTRYALAFCIWGGSLTIMFALLVDQGSALTVTPLPTLSVTAVAVLVLVQLIAFAAWLIFLVRLMMLGRKARSGTLLHAVATDERTKRNQAKATLVSFWTLIVIAGLALPLEIFAGVVLTAKTYGLMLVWIGPAALLLTYAALERRDAA